MQPSGKINIYYLIGGLFVILGIVKNKIEIRGECFIEEAVFSGNKTKTVRCGSERAQTEDSILCSCKECSKEFKIRKRNFFGKSEETRELCLKCSTEKTCLEKYGVSSMNQLPEIKKKQRAYKGTNKEYVLGRLPENKQTNSTEELAQLRSKITSRRWSEGKYEGVDWSTGGIIGHNTESYRENAKKANSKPETKALRTAALKLRWATDEDYRNKMASLDRKISKFQKEIHKILNEKDSNWVLEKPFKDLRYVVDICNEEKKIAIECNGDYWHCNPEKFQADYFNSKKNKTAQQIWEEDDLRKKNLEEIGYKVLIIWENDWKTNRQKIEGFFA